MKDREFSTAKATGRDHKLNEGGNDTGIKLRVAATDRAVSASLKVTNKCHAVARQYRSIAYN